MNNVGLTLDIIAPAFPGCFIYLICFANVCKAMCGVAADTYSPEKGKFMIQI